MDEKSAVPDQATGAPAASQAPAPPATPPENELFSETDSPAQNSALQKVNAATDGVFEKFGQFFKRGRGRPKKDGAPKISDIPLSSVQPSLVPVPAGGPAPAREPDRSVIIRECFKKVGKAGASFLDRILQSKALAASDGDKDFAARVVTETTATPEEIAAFADLGEICLRELKLDLRFLPIVAAGTVLAGGGIRYGLAIRELNAVISEKRAKEKPAEGTNAKV